MHPKNAFWKQKNFSKLSVPSHLKYACAKSFEEIFVWDPKLQDLSFTFQGGTDSWQKSWLSSFNFCFDSQVKTLCSVKWREKQYLKFTAKHVTKQDESWAQRFGSKSRILLLEKRQFLKLYRKRFYFRILNSKTRRGSYPCPSSLFFVSGNCPSQLAAIRREEFP